MVSFLGFCEEGRELRVVLDLRGPGLRAGGFEVEAAGVGGGVMVAEGVEMEDEVDVCAVDDSETCAGAGPCGLGEFSTGCADVAAGAEAGGKGAGWEFAGCHRGHFLASSESSGTSCTSTTSSPANLYRFSIFTILEGS